MKLITTSSREEFDRTAATVVTRAVKKKPHLALTLPTGATPQGLYCELRRRHAEGNFSLDRATVFMLDEYIDLPSYPVRSFFEFLHEHLGEVIFNGRTAITPIRPDGDPRSIDEALDLVGGLDLAIVGVGRNGHVGFNEPGDNYGARTHVVTLLKDTLEANFADVGASERPRAAVTLGLADLRRAKSILMLVDGERKHEVAALLAAGDVDSHTPATQLLDHEDLTIVMSGELLGAV